MMNIPFLINVTDLQRNYRFIIDKVKKSKEPGIVVHNGKPDVVVMDAQTYSDTMKRMKELEEEYFLKATQEALDEYKRGKTVWLKKGQKIRDLH